MTKIKLVIAYDGSDFHGFARQKGLRTVQGTLEQVLERVIGSPTEVFGSGRTDAGVHARAQVVHWVQEVGPPAERYPYLLRRSLPRDIVPIEASVAPDAFHSRFSVKQKTYRYTIQRAPIEDIFTHRYAWYVRESMSEWRMAEAAKYLLGEHDFTSFCAAATPIENKRRTINALDIKERGSYLDIYCTGNGFLQYMVRIIVGTLVDIACGRFEPSDVEQMLAAKDRRQAGRTAPAHGLCLWEVFYPTYNSPLDQT